MITAIINTYNEERNIERCVKALKGFDEVLVCDMESTDATAELARSLGCRIITFPKGDHKCAEPARDFARANARGDWVLFVDADETVTPELRDYLYATASREDAPDGLYLPRKNYFMGTWQRSTYPDYILRFFRRGAGVWPPTVHSNPVVKGRTEHIPASRTELALIHLPVSVDDVMTRMARYTTEEVVRRGPKKVSLAALVIKPMMRFIKSFILKGGFRDGVAGYITAKNSANYKLYTLAKQREEHERLRH